MMIIISLLFSMGVFLSKKKNPGFYKGKPFPFEIGSMVCQNTAARPPWWQAGSREQGKPLTLDGGALDQTGKVQEMQGKGRVKARNSSPDFCGEHKRFQGLAGVWWPPGTHQWPSPEVCDPLGMNHTVCISCLLWSLGCPVLGSLVLHGGFEGRC